MASQKAHKATTTDALKFAISTIPFVVVVIVSTLENSDGFSIRGNRGSPFNLTSMLFNAFPAHLHEPVRNGKVRLSGHPPFMRKKYPTATTGHGDCGWGNVLESDRNARIVGGYTVKSPIPWQASLQSIDADTGRWRHICGAALISQHHLVTASHCIGSENKYRVVLGKVKINEQSMNEQIFYIRESDIITHREFGFAAEFGNDIALLKISDRQGRGAMLTPYVHPICVPDHDGWEFKRMSPKANCVVSGWGSTRNPFSNDMSNTLRVASVPIHSQETCRKLYDNESGRDSFHDNYLKRSSANNREPKKFGKGYGGSQRYVDGMLCAGPLSGSSVDSGRGDSGGPLACKIDGRYYLIGLVSWADNFGGGNPTPGVYTRVSHYKNWLESEKQLLGPGR